MAIDDPKRPRYANGHVKEQSPHYAYGQRPHDLLRTPNKSEKPFRVALLQQLIEKANGKPRAIERIAKKLVQLAEEGNIDAIREVANRCDGQAPRVLAQQDGDVPMFLNVTWLQQPPHQIEQQAKVIDAATDREDKAAD